MAISVIRTGIEEFDLLSKVYVHFEIMIITLKHVLTVYKNDIKLTALSDAEKSLTSNLSVLHTSNSLANSQI